MTGSFITHLTCSECEHNFDHRQLQTYCPDCNKPLLAVYDLEQAQTQWHRERLVARAPDLWRYRELLPVLEQNNIISLGEGYTPLIRIRKSVSGLGLRNVWIKDESQIPTGSFKARGLAMAISKAHELGVTEVAIPTAGNAGGALAAYATKAGMTCHIYMPRDVPRINYMEAKLTGAEVVLIDGLISDCGKIVAEKKQEHGWFDVSTLKEPYRIEGKKTMGLELAEQFDWRLPEVIIYPTGGGTGLIGMWKAFQELQAMGWLAGNLPRMISVQSTGCDPITQAYEAGADDAQFYAGADTLASGLRVPKAFGDRLILRALRESGGCAISVSDADILAGMRKLAATEGMVVCPEGAATWVALKQLHEKRLVAANERVVLFNTGSGLKYPEVLRLVTDGE